MSQKFIDEVRAIVLSNFSDEKFGAPDLASKLGLSSSQTLKKVKVATGKSVNQYIRELRLEKAAKLIKTTDFTIAEISYQVGFGSASYFNKAFSSFYGIAPGEYKTKNIGLIELAVKKAKNKHREVSLKQKIFFPVILVLVLVIGYLVIENSISKNNPLGNSIAVLPFKDFSPEDSQWFSDGVSDNILHSLAQMKDLSVISFTSSSTYRDTDKQIPEIADELGVSYILEGSVTLYENNIKIIAQLIDSNDNHVWSKEYTESFDNMMVIQNNVAQQVMKQLEITLSPQEEVTLARFPTKNMEAYNLFLKGRLINDSRKVEDLWQNIDLNKQAIALDSSFAEAYAEIAHSYYLIAHYNYLDIFEGRQLSEKYADRALKVDPNNAKALTVKGALIAFINWELAEKYIENALAVNPNDAYAHFEYSHYFLKRRNPDMKKRLYEVRIAQRLDPLSAVIGSNYFRALIVGNKLEEAEAYLNKMGFLGGERWDLWLRPILLAYKNKDWSVVIPFLEKKIEKEPNNTLLYRKLAVAYDEILNDNITAISYCKKAYEMDSTSSTTARLYLGYLNKGEKFKKAKSLMESKNYKSVVSKEGQVIDLWDYFYYQGNSKKTQEILKDSVLKNQYWFHALTYAQIGDQKKVDSLNNRYPWGDNRLRAKRAILHAILKNKDSMYYYLETTKFDLTMVNFNSRREFDPYRNEERYKAILRDNYIPVPGE